MQGCDRHLKQCAGLSQKNSFSMLHPVIFSQFVCFLCMFELLIQLRGI